MDRNNHLAREQDDVRINMEEWSEECYSTRNNVNSRCRIGVSILKKNVNRNPTHDKPKRKVSFSPIDHVMLIEPRSSSYCTCSDCSELNMTMKRKGTGSSRRDYTENFLLFCTCICFLYYVWIWYACWYLSD